MCYFGKYGCSCEHDSIALEAPNKQKAIEYVYESAIESYQSFEGFHGTRSWKEIAEDVGALETNTNTDEIDILYNEEVENDIHYSVEEFDYQNEEHMSVLREQEMNFWVV